MQKGQHFPPTTAGSQMGPEAIAENKNVQDASGIYFSREGVFFWVFLYYGVVEEPFLLLSGFNEICRRAAGFDI